MGKTDRLIYQIDDNDRIVFVNDAWDDLARENNIPNLTSQFIIDKSLWGFIADVDTVQIYQDIVKCVRGGRGIDFEFRCDAPEMCRSVKMKIYPADAGGVIFETKILREWKRHPPPLLQNNTERNGELLRICGWCKKINVGRNLWEEIEKAVKSLGLFEKENFLPRLTHGICDDCYQSVTRKFQKA